MLLQAALRASPSRRALAHARHELRKMQRRSTRSPPAPLIAFSTRARPRAIGVHTTRPAADAGVPPLPGDLSDSIEFEELPDFSARALPPTGAARRPRRLGLTEPFSASSGLDGAPGSREAGQAPRERMQVCGTVPYWV